MTIAQEIEARIADLGSGRLHWVQGPGTRDGEACLVYNYKITLYEQVLGLPRPVSHQSRSLSMGAYHWLNDWWLLSTAADIRPDDQYGYGVVVWNDKVPTSVDEVIDMLAWAWMDAIEEGV